MSSTKAALRLAEAIDESGKLTRKGSDSLVHTIQEFSKIARSSGCAEIMAFATSAVRDATNSDEVLTRVKKETGVDLAVLSGVNESRLTFLAVRRWYGWSAGRIINLDIGGGSLELSCGVDEEPDIALSLPLGAGRLTREWLAEDPPGRRRVAMLRDWLESELVDAAKQVAAAGVPDLAVASSKTFRSLARLTGAAPSGAGPRVKRTLTSKRTASVDRVHLANDYRRPCGVGGSQCRQGASDRRRSTRRGGKHACSVVRGGRHLPVGSARRANSAQAG